MESQKWPNPVKKAQLQIEEDLGGKVTGWKLGITKGFVKIYLSSCD